MPRPAADDSAIAGGRTWVLGLLAGVLAIGPGLGAGSLLNLDLVTAPDLPVPAGVWGLGPELPRRVPLFVPVAWLGHLVGGDLVVKALLVLTVAIALVGVVRLLEDLPPAVALGAGALYGLSPALLTRLEVGHLTLALGTALLPWALPVLLDPGRSGSRTLRWSALLALAGVQGGLLMAVVGGIGLASTRGRRWRTALLAALLGQLPWLVPGLVVWAQSSGPVGGAAFPTRIAGLPGALALLVGDGFWQPALQLGWEGERVDAVLAVALLGLAAAGWRHLPAPRRGPLAAMAAIGLLVTLAGATPALRGPWEELTATWVGAPIREGQRLLPLALLVLHLAAAHGAAALARRAEGAAADVAAQAPLVLALLVAAPALWGLGGALRPTAWPDDLRAARAAVREEPGTVAVLPWHLYLDVSWAGGRRLLNPVPLYFGGDVITSSDPELGSARPERSDPREPHVAHLVEQARLGRATGADWAALGVRWIVVLHEVDWRDFDALGVDAGLRVRLEGPSVTLVEVTGWPGAAVGADGAPVPLDPVAAPLAQLAEGGEVVVHRPGGWGWRRGTASATTGPTGLLVAPAGSGPLWYPPAVAVLLGHVATLAACSATVRVRRRPRRLRPVDH